MNLRYSWLLIGILIWPIIVNSQPGSQFLYLGIDWKADNLDGTLFWVGIIMLIVLFIGLSIGNRKRLKKYGQKDKERDI